MHPPSPLSSNRMTRPLLTGLAILALAFAVAGSAAENQSPEELVRSITEHVLAAIRQDPALKAGDRTKALALAEEKVLPHVDFAEATRLAAGRTWNAATPTQRERLVQEFRSMLVRVYSVSIDTYRGQTMSVLPVQMAPGAIQVIVRNRYVRPGAPPVVVAYAMHLTDSGWKIYDISVEGMSLVLTYRSQFEQIGRQSGIDGLINLMAERNRPSR